MQWQILLQRLGGSCLRHDARTNLQQVRGWLCKRGPEAVQIELVQICVHTEYIIIYFVVKR